MRDIVEAHRKLWEAQSDLFVAYVRLSVPFWEAWIIMNPFCQSANGRILSVISSPFGQHEIIRVRFG